MSADKTVGGRTREEEPSAGVGGFSLVDLADAHAWTLEWIGRDPTCGNVPALATLLAKRFAEGQADAHSRGIREGLERAARVADKFVRPLSQVRPSAGLVQRFQGEQEAAEGIAAAIRAEASKLEGR